MRVCVEWWTALSAYVDEALPPDERQRLEAHLQQCAACQEGVVYLHALRRSVSLLPAYEPPPTLKARILSATVDKPTWRERLAMNWRPVAWRVSLAAAVVLLVVWRLTPRQVPEAVSTLVSSVTQNRTASSSQQAVKPPLLQEQTPLVMASGKPAAAQRAAQRRRGSAVKPSSPSGREVRWTTTVRHPIASQPAPVDVLQGEPVIGEDVPYIDVNSPPAGEPVADQPEEESKTVASRFTLPAEVLSSGTQGLESLREQIRIRNAEQLSDRIERKIERKQVEVDVIKVRF